MNSRLSYKTLFSVWIINVLIYLTWVWRFDLPFVILVISFLSNICILPILMQKNTQLSVDDAVEFVNFHAGNMCIGELKIPISRIKKVAIDSIGTDGFFSLPYNHIASLGVPNFTFPAENIPSFKQYLIENLRDVEFIT